jgi:hypothetical protein
VSSLDDADSDDGDAEASFDGLALLLLSLRIFSDCVNSCHPAGRGGGLCGGGGLGGGMGMVSARVKRDRAMSNVSDEGGNGGTVLVAATARL